mgnify:CR=1 FL=1
MKNEEFRNLIKKIDNISENDAHSAAIDRMQKKIQSQRSRSHTYCCCCYDRPSSLSLFSSCDGDGAHAFYSLGPAPSLPSS